MASQKLAKFEICLLFGSFVTQVQVSFICQEYNVFASINNCLNACTANYLISPPPLLSNLLANALLISETAGLSKLFLT